MNISPLQNQPQSISAPRIVLSKAKQGLAGMPDRLETKKVEPPSIFRALIRPFFDILKIIGRSVFAFFDFLREICKDEPEKTFSDLSKDRFIERLCPETTLAEFEKMYSREEQSKVYHAIGQSHKKRLSWKELIWPRSLQDNLILGRSLAMRNPSLLRKYLLN
jgi:hypothetical protein